jgi:hypothetical protein
MCSGIRSTFGSNYRRMQAVTRHSPSGRDSTTATREPQLFVHVTEEERKELQRTFDQATANAGTVCFSCPDDSKTHTHRPASGAAPTAGPRPRPPALLHARMHTHTRAVAFSHAIKTLQGRLGRSCCARSGTRQLRAHRAVSTGAMRLGGARLISWYRGVSSKLSSQSQSV